MPVSGATAAPPQAVQGSSARPSADSGFAWNARQSVLEFTMGVKGPATQAAGPHLSDRRLYKCHAAPPSARRTEPKVRGQKSQAQTASGNACRALASSHPTATQATGQQVAAAQHDTSAQQAAGSKPEAQQVDGDAESMDWSLSAIMPTVTGSNVALQQNSNAATLVDGNSW